MVSSTGEDAKVTIAANLKLGKLTTVGAISYFS